MKELIRLVIYVLLCFVCSCAFGYEEFTRKLEAENDELEKIKPVKVCDINKSSKYIKATISVKHSDNKKNKSTQLSERLLITTCFSQPHPKKIKADMTPWGKRLWFDFTHFYGLANGYPEDESSLRHEAEKNCEMLLSDYRSYHKHYEIPASCGIAECQVCEY